MGWPRGALCSAARSCTLLKLTGLNGKMPSINALHSPVALSVSEDFVWWSACTL